MNNPPVISYEPRKVAGDRPRWKRPLIAWVLFVGLAVMIISLLRQNVHGTDIPLDRFYARLLDGQVRSVWIGDERLTGEFVAPQQIGGAPVVRFSVSLPRGMSGDWRLAQFLLDNANGASVQSRSESYLLELLLPLIPWLLIFAFVWFFIVRQLRNARTQAPAPVPVYLVERPVEEQSPPAST